MTRRGLLTSMLAKAKLILRKARSLLGEAKDWNQNGDFFRFTRGRFVCNETEEMAQRSVTFDMNELCNVAASAVGSQCVEVEKCADGMHNKAFLLTMRDKQQVVAKIPNPNAGFPHLTTASEVATMDFMRDVLQTPTPRVITWNSNRDNPVRSEYIIMEMAQGVQLERVWAKLEDNQKTQIARTVAKFQKNWTNHSFNRIGSLYYAKDLHGEISDENLVDTDPKFCIGPIVGRDWVDHGRASLACDRGPWSTAQSYRRAAIERDMQAVRAAEVLPKPLSMVCGPGLYQVTKESKLWAGERTLLALPHAMPGEDWATSSYLWHDDLHVENIFVDADDPGRITTIIDWQSTCVTPLFDHTMIPGFLDYKGPYIQGLERPPLPELPADTSDEAYNAAVALNMSQTLAVAYKHLLKKTNSPAFEALMYDESESSLLLGASRRLFETPEMYCLGCIADLEHPALSFGKEDYAKIEDGLEKTTASIHIMDVIKKDMGDFFPDDGVVSHERYDIIKRRLREIKAQVLEDFAQTPEDRQAFEEAWPFDD